MSGKITKNCNQLKSYVKVLHLQKQRNIRVSICEYCSHFLIFILLLLGYSLSTLEYLPSEDYSELKLTFPPSFIKLPSTERIVNGNNSSFINGTIIDDDYVDVIAINSTIGINANEAVNFINDLLTGPIIPPTFDQFIGLGRLVQSSSDLTQQFDGLSSSSFVQQYGNLIRTGEMHFAPFPSPEVSSLINYFNETTTSFNTLTIRTHDTEEDAVDYISNNPENYAFALIVIHEIKPEKVNYEIRLNFTTLPNTRRIIYNNVRGMNTRYQQYFLSGYLTLQNVVDTWAFGYTSDSCIPPAPVFMPFPTYEYNQNPFYTRIGFLLGIAMTMASLYPLSSLVKSIVEEKESKMKELMYIMGMPEWIHDLSWFITALILFTWIALSLTYLTHTTFLAKSDVTLLFSYFFLFCLSKINLGFLISVFFNSSKLAAVAGPAILFSFILPRYIFFGTSTNDDSRAKIIASILSPTAFTFGADILADYEFGGYGVQYFNMYDGDYNFGTCLNMMFLDSIIYGLVAWYLDKVLSKEYGIPRHKLFFLLPSYWKSFNIFQSKDIINNNDPLFKEIELTPVLQSKKHINIPYESVPEENNDGNKNIVISSLHKMFDNGKIAVKSLDLTLVANQITCLLGANGAGKSTTMTMLTGMIQPTSGDINIFGMDMSNQIDKIRQQIGICPQQNVHFDMLTVEEHVNFFALLKGIESGKVLNDAVNNIIDDVGLTEKKNTPSKNLSGGMKRKLSLAMALIGDSKLILLDEPTSGLDPYARKAVWELLKKHKKEKDCVIVLSTHYMWEADHLADRIAILSEGSLVALASPNYLKSELGLGYVLSLSKSFPHTPEKEIDAFIYDSFPNGKSAAKSAAREMSFFLPFEDVPKFGDFFTKLEGCSKELEIDSYGISLTSLEQIFIKIAQNAAEKEDNIEVMANEITNDEIVVNKEKKEENKDKAKVLLIENSSPVKIYSPVINDDNQKDIHGDIELNDVNNINDSNKIECDENFVHNADKNITSNINETNKSSFFYKLTSNFIADKNEANDNNINDDNIWLIQLKMLLYKRYLNSLRDVSGFFFQIVVPALQIFLVLSILMISFNPAGRTLKMNTSIFFPYVGHINVISFDGTYSLNDTIVNTTGTTTVITENITDINITTPQPPYFETLSKYLSKENMNIEVYDSLVTPLDSSNDMSKYLLDTYETVRPDRYGVFIADDAINLYLKVLWKDVQKNLPLLLSQDALNIYAEIFALLPDDTFPITIRDLPTNIQDIIIENLQDNLFNVTNSTGNTFEDILDFIEDLTNANVSAALSNAAVNTTIEETLNNQTFTNDQILDATLDIDNVIANSEGIEIIGLSVTIGNTTFNVGNIFLTYQQISDLLPTTTIEYLFVFPRNPFSIMHNTTSPHAVAALNGELVTASFQQCQNTTESKYLAKSHQLPVTLKQSLEIQAVVSILACLFILVPLCYIPASFVPFIVKERVSKSKHIQFVSSITPQMYWISTLIFDFILYCILFCFILIAFAVYGETSAAIFLSTSSEVFALCLLFLTYGLSVIPLSYLYSLFFDSHSTAQISIMVINFFTGFVSILAYFILSSIEDTRDAGETLVHIFRLFPSYNIGEGLLALTTAWYSDEFLKTETIYTDWDVSGRNITFMLIQSFVYFGLLIVLELSYIAKIRIFLNKIWILFRNEIISKFNSITPTYLSLIKSDSDTIIRSDIKKVSDIELVKVNDVEDNIVNINSKVLINDDGDNSDDDDSDVKDEKILVEKCFNSLYDSESQLPSYSFLINKLSKTYNAPFCGGSAKRAVRNLSLSISEGETFGLLGVNGAGKSTTLGILTGDIDPTEGDVKIKGLNLQDPKTRLLIGFCPQTDPLIDLMNSYETLYFYGRIRGIKDEILVERVNSLIKQVGLTKHASFLSGTYSGGNKRKLSLAVALIGNPALLILDEPSSGMDPYARRMMWSTISEVGKSRSVLLTTHSMEECEALCSRISIMVAGKLTCIGTSQHLKKKYGIGYQVEIKFGINDINLTESEEQLDNLIFSEYLERIEFLTSSLPSLSLEEQHNNLARFSLITNNSTSALGDMFNFLELHKVKLQISDYSVSQFPLEQIFNNFAAANET